MATILRRPAAMQQPATYNQARATGMPPPMASPQSTRTGNPPPTPAPSANRPGSQPAPPGFPTRAAWSIDQQRQRDQAAVDKFKAGGGVLPPGALLSGDPRLQAGGGPLGYSGTYYQTGN